MHLGTSPTARIRTQPAPSGARKHVFLIGRHPLVQEWLAHILSNEPGVAVCGRAVTAASAIDEIAPLNPHAVVMDLNLEDGSGFQDIERIRWCCPHTAVLALSSRDEPYYADRALRAGARGFISTLEPTRKIVAALRCVIEGKVYLSASATQCVIGKRSREPLRRGAPSIETLSDRELEIFAMTGRGLGTRRIADILHLSPKTIQAYHGRIKDKLQLRDANELMREAIHWVEGATKRRRSMTLPPGYDESSAIGAVTTLPPAY